MYCKTYLESDHWLLVSRLRLKLKVWHKRVQRHCRHQVNARLLNDQQVSEFVSVLVDELAVGPKGDVEEA